MRPSDVASALRSLIPTRRPLYLWGPPGIGKSSLVKQACEGLDLHMIDLRAVLLDPVDLRGLPRINGDRADWCPPSFWPKGGQGVIFLDELAQAPPLVQAGLLQGVLDNQIGETQIPPGWIWIAASNRQEDRAGAHRIITPLLNRFVHLDLEVSNEDWMAWALEAKIAPEVRSFINWKPSLLFDFDPSQNKRAFPTPRSWSFVSDILGATPSELLLPVAMGCVGEGPAVEFAGFVKIYRELPDPEEVLRDPLKSRVPREPAVLYALCGALVERLRQGDLALLGRFVTYAGRLPDEFTVLAFSDGIKVNANLLRAPGASQLMAKHREVLLSKAS